MSWAEVELLKREIDAVEDKVQLLANRTYGIVPPITSNNATNPTTTYSTASASAVAGSTVDFQFDGAKNIYAIKFKPLTSGSTANHGTFDKMILMIDGTSIELGCGSQKMTYSNGNEYIATWLGSSTNRIRLVATDDNDEVTCTFPVQIKCTSSVTIKLNCTTSADDGYKLRCHILYSK